MTGVSMPSIPFNISVSMSAVRTRFVDALLQLFQLAERNGGLQFAHAVVERHEIVVGIRVAVAPGLVDVEEHVAGDRFVVGHDHAAFAGGHVLALLEAKAADVADRAGHLIAVPSRERSARNLRSRACRALSLSAMISSISHGLPNRCVTMIALVRSRIMAFDRFGGDV